MNLWLTRTTLFQSYGRSVALRGAALAIALLVLAAGRFTVVAQDASPGATDSALAALGYPELRIVVTDDSFVAPQEVAGRRYLVVLENQGTPDVTLDDLNQALFAEGAPIPDWFGEIVSTGGFSAADLTVELSDFGFDLPDQIAEGRQVWDASNAGGQSHEMILVKTPELLTAEQVLAVVSLPEGGTPPAGVPDPATFEFLSAGLKTISPGREIWVELDLAPGSYVALCLNVDAESGAPHAMLGMVDVFTVGQPAA